MSNITLIQNYTTDQSNYVKYIIMQTCYIPSIICSIFTLTNLLLNRNLRLALHNHTSIILLFISIFDSFFNHPLTLNYLRLSHVVPSTDGLCLFWNFTNSIFVVSTYWTVAWGSIEKHLFIFYSTIFATQRRRILFHYIPLLITTFIYPVVSNIIIILFYPCENHFNMMSLYCAFPCALYIQSVALYTRFAHNFIPTFTVVGFTLALLVRVIKQKRQMQNNQFNWRKFRRMISQLLLLVGLFLSVTLPATIVSIIQNCCLSTFAATLQTSYFNFLIRFLTMFMPFICLISFPEIWSKLLWWNNIQIHRA
ncbi:unnamed protein product [Adineta steineri]|uniref:G-protein coupled receptors family 1 profile domain-containing protein n=1 Tax=Adineta steineri TaxID=433720 RepID=A0A818W6V6_9BILA|nr:unnamed protein product [Adineta steineri]